MFGGCVPLMMIPNHQLYLDKKMFDPYILLKELDLPRDSGDSFSCMIFSLCAQCQYSFWGKVLTWKLGSFPAYSSQNQCQNKVTKKKQPVWSLGRNICCRILFSIFCILQDKIGLQFLHNFCIPT